MEASGSSEMLEPIYQTTRRHFPEYLNQGHDLTSHNTLIKVTTSLPRYLNQGHVLTSQNTLIKVDL
jgi:hypothetical protein